MESLARTVSLPRPVMVGKESRAVSGILVAVSRTGCWLALAEAFCNDERDAEKDAKVDAGGMGRGAKGGLRPVVLSIVSAPCCASGDGMVLTTVGPVFSAVLPLCCEPAICCASYLTARGIEGEEY